MIVELHLQSFAASERLSRSFKVTVCLIGRQQQQRAAGLLLSALKAADIELRAPARVAVDRYLRLVPALSSNLCG